MSESVQNWRECWFYVKDEVAAGQSTGLPPFNPEAELTKKRSWNNALSQTEEKDAKELLAKVVDLQTTEGRVLTGAHLVITFLWRRVQPLQARVAAGRW